MESLRKELTARNLFNAFCISFRSRPIGTTTPTLAAMLSHSATKNYLDIFISCSGADVQQYWRDELTDLNTLYAELESDFDPVSKEIALRAIELYDLTA